jgi:hypothetical protein
MSDRARELAARHAELQLRCALQRRAIEQEVRSVEARFDSVDRIVGVARTVLSNPVVITGGVLTLLIFGRLGALRLLGNAVLLALGARQSLQALKRF